MSTSDSTQFDLKIKSLLQEANRCVACGLCLPHCPTYRKTQTEADSPRGRIALIKGVLENKIPHNQSFVQHIDTCLTCRACESSCPSRVEYGRIVDGVRPLIESTRNKSRIKSTLINYVFRRLLRSPFQLRTLGRGLRFYQQAGIRRVVRASGILDALKLADIESELPELPSIQTWKEIYPASGEERGTVGLFLGCISRLTDTETLNASIYVLNHLGYTVFIPSLQGCCGALPQHAGQTERAAELAMQNKQAFSMRKLDAIISTASGCGAQLSEYHTLPEVSEPALSSRVMDISEFLDKAQGWDGIKLNPLTTKVVVQEPCTLRNVQRAGKFSYSVLARIPDAQIESLSGNDQCCGAAGIYHIQQPVMAGLLRDDKIASLVQSGAKYMVTSNVGCAMWLAQGMHKQGIEIEVLHPVTLVARQMGFTGKC